VWTHVSDTAHQLGVSLSYRKERFVSVTRQQLVDALAKSSHDVYERHYRESGKPEAEMVRMVNEHDRDRAEAAVDVLEELGLWADPDAPNGGGPLLGVG
jgi:hypothetical protein